MSEAKRKRPPGFSTRAKAVEIGLADEAPLPVLLLRPGIGIEQVDPVERGRRQPVEHARRVVVIDPEIGERRFRRALTISLRHAVDEGLDADEAGRRARRGRDAADARRRRSRSPAEPLDTAPRNSARKSAGRRRAEIDADSAASTLVQRAGLLRANGLAVPAAEERFGRAAAAFVRSWRLQPLRPRRRP